MPRSESQKKADRKYNKSTKGLARTARYKSKIKSSRPPKKQKCCIICGEVALAKDLCSRHYQQMRRDLQIVLTNKISDDMFK